MNEEWMSKWMSEWVSEQRLENSLDNLLRSFQPSGFIHLLWNKVLKSAFVHVCANVCVCVCVCYISRRRMVSTTWRWQISSCHSQGHSEGQTRGNWESGMDGKVRRQQPVHCLPPSLPCQGPGGSIGKLKCWWEELGHLDAGLKGGPGVHR